MNGTNWILEQATQWQPPPLQLHDEDDQPRWLCDPQHLKLVLDCLFSHSAGDVEIEELSRVISQHQSDAPKAGTRAYTYEVVRQAEIWVNSCLHRHPDFQKMKVSFIHHITKTTAVMNVRWYYHIRVSIQIDGT